MKKITREQAEQLFEKENVINSKIEQDKNELCISMTLSNNKSCLIKFDIKSRQKSYFLETFK